MDLRTCVFLGASLPKSEALATCPNISVMSPIARGDAYRARLSGYNVLVIIDGFFAQNLAIPPREIIDVMASGAVVIGASSMGALRGAECHSAGMIGIGLITRLYRMGILESDDEVAVEMSPFSNFEAITVPLINIRYALSKAKRAGTLEAECARRIFEKATSLHYSDRTIRNLLDHTDKTSGFLEALQFYDLKRRDAIKALRAVASWCADGTLRGMVRYLPDRFQFEPMVRYPGHDRCYGHSPVEWRRALFFWLIGSGRYQIYIVPLLIVETRASVKNLGANFESVSPEARREILIDRLDAFLGNIAAATDHFWDELEYLDEADAESARLYAHKKMASFCSTPGPDWLEWAQNCVAIRHGFTEWRHLLSFVKEGKLHGVIPYEWIDDAVVMIAAARAARGISSGVVRG